MNNKNASDKFQETYQLKRPLYSSLTNYSEFGYFSELQMLSSFTDFIKEEQRKKYIYSSPSPIHLHKDVFDMATVQELFLGWCEYRWFTMNEENMLSENIPTGFFADEIKYEIQGFRLYGR